MRSCAAVLNTVCVATGRDQQLRNNVQEQLLSSASTHCFAVCLDSTHTHTHTHTVVTVWPLHSPHRLTGRVGGALKIVAGEDIAVGSHINIAYSGGKPRSDRFLQD